MKNIKSQDGGFTYETIKHIHDQPGRPNEREIGTYRQNATKKAEGTIKNLLITDNKPEIREGIN